MTNPLSQDHAFLRQALVGSLAAIADTNLRRGTEDVAIFEVGKGYGKVGDEPREWWRLAVALAGAFEGAAWNRPARAADIDDAKGVIEAIATLLEADAVHYAPLTDEPLLHPGRSATVSATRHGRGTDGESTLVLSGIVGELHPRVLADAGLRLDRLVVAEVSVAGLAGGRLPVSAAAPPPRFPAVERDLAIVISAPVVASAVAATIQASGGALLQSVSLFDVYHGRPLGPDERSLAFRLRFGAADRTLTEAEVDAAVAAIVADLQAAHAARIRT